MPDFDVVIIGGDRVLDSTIRLLGDVPFVESFINVIKLFGLRGAAAVLTDAVVTRPSGEVTESSANAGRIRLEQGRRGVIR